MKKRKRNSGLFKKYFLVTIGIILACFFVIGTSLMLLVSGLWLNEKTESLETTTESVTRNIYNTMTSNMLVQGRSSVIVICNTLMQVSQAVDADIFVINENGVVVYCKHMLNSASLMDNGKCLVHKNYLITGDVLVNLQAGENYNKIGNLDGQLAKEHFISGCPIMVGDDFRGAVIATQPVASGLLPYLKTISEMFLFASLFAFVLAFILVYAVSYSLTKPLREMSIAAKKYANGDFSDRINSRTFGRRLLGPTEIDELADSFNSMAQALASLEYSRRSFVSNVSHELKTPMTTIGGFIDGILDGTIGKDEEEKYLKIVSEEVKRLSRLVTSMLNLSRIESGHQDINPSNFDLNLMIFNTLLSFEQIIEQKGIDIRGLDSFEENPVFADKDMINQVIYNLVDNAVKFTPDGGYIEVVSKCDAEKAIVKIRNSGKGITPEEINNIFDRFYKVDKSRSFDVKSTGLGLYLVKKFIELHGGNIECHSVIDEYTEFVFNLPL